ncbi:MAG TPA: radical SAM protein [Pseudobacteroides sp.]|nr:radical SAM protein [Pseudobacteroides sp.]
MEWELKIKDLFEKLVAEVPDGFRPAVKPLLFETAEKKCLGRNGSYVNEADLITALIDVTPGPFKSESIRICTSLGIDIKRYIELSEIQQTYKMSWEKIGKAFHPGNMHFSMYVTDKCNQKCLHCAANTKHYRPELPIEKWIEIIENLEGSLRRQGRRGVYIWFGGEPTCRDDIRELIKYCGDKGYNQSLITNGVLFDDEFAKYCADNGMSHVFVSIDSADPEKSDRMRGIKNSLDYAKKAIQSAVKYGLFTCCSTTVMKLNIDELQQIKDLVESLKAQPYFRAIVKQKNAALNWDEVGLNSEGYKKLYDFKYANAIEKIRNGKAGALPAYEVFEMVPFLEQTCNDAELTAIEWGVGCQACRCFSGIDVNGDIFPCGYPSKLILGNALRDSFEDIMNSQLFKDIRDKKRIGKCATCHHIDLCGGGCRVHAESETGDFFESFSYCWHENDHAHKEL